MCVSPCTEDLLAVLCFPGNNEFKDKSSVAARVLWALLEKERKETERKRGSFTCWLPWFQW